MNASHKNTLILFILSLSGLFGSYFLNGYLAHHLNIYIYADYSIALKFLDIVVSITLFGTDVGSVCYLSKYLLNHQKKSLEDYIIWNVKLVSVNLVIVRILAWITFIIMLLMHVYGVRHIENYSIFMFVIWITPFAALFKLVSSFLTGIDLPITSMFISNTLLYIVQFLFFAALISMLNISLSYSIIAVILAGTYSLLTVISAHWLDKNTKKLIRLGLNEFFVTPILHPVWFPSLLKIISNSILFMLICSMDLLIVRFFSPNPKDTGCYAAILSIISFFALVPKNLYQDLKPSLSYHLTSPEGCREVQKEMNHTNKIVFLILTLASVLIILFSKPLLGYFGEEYLRGQTALILLTVLLWYSSLSQFSGTLLIYGNLEGTALRGCFLQILFILSATVPATYYFGMNGTALTTGLAFVLNSIYCSTQVKRHLGIHSMLIPGYMPPVS